MYFRDIIGQSAVAERLRAAFDTRRLGHATLLRGREGHGTLPLALALARYVLCTAREGGEACGRCPSCRKIDKLVHPDLHFVYPVPSGGGKEPVSDSYVAQWRKFVAEDPWRDLTAWMRALGGESKQAEIRKDESEAINRKLALKSFEGEYKVVVVWQSDRMNETASNKILKILEEPPAGTLFFLLSGHPERMLQTIQSRVQAVDVPPLSAADLAADLESRGLPASEARDLALFAEGDLARARQLVDRRDELQAGVENFERFVRYARGRQTAELVQLIETAFGKDKTAQAEFLAYVMHHFRQRMLDPAQAADLAGQRVTLSQARRVYDLVNTAMAQIERNVNARIVLFDTSIKLRRILDGQ